MPGVAGAVCFAGIVGPGLGHVDAPVVVPVGGVPVIGPVAGVVVVVPVCCAPVGAPEVGAVDELPGGGVPLVAASKQSYEGNNMF